MSLDAELDRCRPFLEPALARNGGTHGWEDIAEGVRSGRMQLWPAEDAALVTELARFPQRKVCNVFLGGGRLPRLIEMIPAVEAWAKAQGCHAITVHGRKGWERVLARATGAAPLHTVMHKELAPWPAD